MISCLQEALLSGALHSQASRSSVNILADLFFHLLIAHMASSLFSATVKFFSILDDSWPLTINHSILLDSAECSSIHLSMHCIAIVVLKIWNRFQNFTGVDILPLIHKCFPYQPQVSKRGRLPYVFHLLTEAPQIRTDQALPSKQKQTTLLW